MLRINIVFGFVFSIVFNLNAQQLKQPLINDLSFIPELKVTIIDSSFLKSANYLGFTTFDAHPLMDEQQFFGSSFQITSASAPYPPKIFGSLNKTGNYKNKQFTDFRIQPNGCKSVFLSYINDSGTPVSEYLIFNKGNDGRYVVVDTFKGNGSQIDGHSLIIDDKGHYWFLSNLFHRYDMSGITGRAKDTAAYVRTTGVGVWDPVKRKTIFEMDLWDRGLVPVKDIPLDLVLGSMITDTGAVNPVFDLTHPNSWYPMDMEDECPIGILSDLYDGVKFIRLCDSTVLRYGSSNPDFSPTDDANHQLLQQHDFRKLTHGIYAGFYSCFDNGDSSLYTQHSRVPIIDFDFDKRTCRMIAELDFPTVFSAFQGNIDFIDKYVLVNFGGSPTQLTGGPNWVIYDLLQHKTAAEYRLPPANFAYAVWFMNDSITVPEINCTADNKMWIDSKLWKDPVWSTGNSTYAITAKAGNSRYVTTNAGGVFRFSSSIKDCAPKKKIPDSVSSKWHFQKPAPANAVFTIYTQP